MRNVIIAAMLLGSAAALAPAQSGFDAASAARAIAPFIDEQTIAVARIDVASLDVKAAFAKLAELVRRVETEEQDTQAALKQLSQGQQMAQQWADEFRRAGGREIYYVVSLADLGGMPVFLVVPLGGRADARMMIDFLRRRSVGPATAPASAGERAKATGPSLLPLPPEVYAQVGGAVFAGSSAQLERIRKGKPAVRPEVEKGFAAAGPGIAQGLLLHTADSRRVIGEMMPELPEEVGGGPSTAITRGMTWAAIGAAGPPKMSLRLTIQSQDASSAKALSKLIKGIVGAALEAAAKEESFTEIAPIIKAHLPMLLPKVAGDRLVVSLDEKQLDLLLLDVAAPSIGRARAKARGAVSMQNVMAITRTIHMYASDHDGEAPPDLEALVKAKLTSPRLLVNLRRPELKVGYVYIRPPVPLEKIKNVHEVILIYEPYERWKDGIVVGFADGHVEMIRDEARFEKLLARTKALKPGKE